MISRKMDQKSLSMKMIFNWSSPNDFFTTWRGVFDLTVQKKTGFGSDFIWRFFENSVNKSLHIFVGCIWKTLSLRIHGHEMKRNQISLSGSCFSLWNANHGQIRQSIHSPKSTILWLKFACIIIKWSTQVQQELSA